MASAMWRLPVNTTIIQAHRVRLKLEVVVVFFVVFILVVY
jgi:hypothetical protein